MKSTLSRFKDKELSPLDKILLRGVYTNDWIELGLKSDPFAIKQRTPVKKRMNIDIQEIN